MSARDATLQVKRRSTRGSRQLLPLDELAPSVGEAAQGVLVRRANAARGEQGCQEELIVTAGKHLTLRCGKSSITLTAAGKIIIRGKYIVSRSSGVHRIKGGSVQIN